MLVAQVREAEVAFARTMAERSLTGFASFLADDAVFANGGTPLRGRAAIVEHWKRFFVDRAAPFSWAPSLVEVTSRGDLGYTEGPVSSPAGVVFARFWTTWRRHTDGRWLVAFDSGQPTCRDARG